jgi:hypothetical protein
MPDCVDLCRLRLDNRPVFYKKPLLLLRFGRIAQRESVPFTRERSKVRSLVRPPEKPLIYVALFQPFQ